jgi:uncharacterized OsmC-like protein
MSPQKRETTATAPDAAASTTSGAGLAELTPEHSGWKAVTVEHLDGERYVIGVRGHLVTVDQPLADGGADTAPTPTELLVASLASCVAFYAGRYLDRHGFSRRGLRVAADFTMAVDRPARIESVRLTATAPSLPEDRRAAFQAVISHCTVHNTLHQTPRIDIKVDIKAD